MVYTEIRKINDKKYYYRAISLREGNKILKRRIYLGYNLSNFALSKKEKLADEVLLSKKIMKINKGIKEISLKIINILKKYNIRRAGIFGSYVRGEEKKSSDIDILIRPTKNMSLLDISGLKIELENVLGRKVDIISYKYIHPYLKDRILKSEMRII